MGMDFAHPPQPTLPLYVYINNLDFSIHYLYFNFRMHSNSITISKFLLSFSLTIILKIVHPLSLSSLSH